jgi:hypothetical protein
MPVNLIELQAAVELVSSSDIGESQAWVCAQSGQIYWQFDPMISGEVNEELPDNIEDEEKYLPVPNKRTLDLGKPLVLDFVDKFLPDDFDDVRQMFGRRGAYRNFRQLVTRRRVLDQWYAFEEQATKKALREWCELNSIPVAD